MAASIVHSDADCVKLSYSHLLCSPDVMGIPINFGMTATFKDPLTPAIEAINQLVGSLGPLKPVLDILGVVVQIVKCVQAVPDCITSLDPSGLIKCVPELVKKVAALAGLIPPASLYKTVAGAVCLLIEVLSAIAVFLKAIRKALEEIGAAFSQNLSLNDANLSALISCGESNVLGMLDDMAGIFDLISVIVGIVNIFLELAGQKKISLGGDIGLGGSSNASPEFLDAIINTLTATVKSLKAVLLVIPTGLAMGSV